MPPSRLLPRRCQRSHQAQIYGLGFVLSRPSIFRGLYLGEATFMDQDDKRLGDQEASVMVAQDRQMSLE